MTTVVLLLTHSAAASEPEVAVAGFVDAYYAADLDEGRRRPTFLYNHARQDDVNVNLALVRMGLSADATRATLGLMAGTYAHHNLAHEQPLIRAVFEANAGFRIVEDLWLDAGILPSHIGFESAISMANATLTRSIMAESSPYYLAGARLGWAPEGPIGAALVVANGWQNVRETNRSKGAGSQLVARGAGERLTVNWSTWVSNEQPSGSPGLRVFNDLYATWAVDRGSVTVAVDVGGQDAGASWATFYGAALVGRVVLHEPVALSGRVERYADPDGVIVAPLGAGAVLNGGSLGVDLLLGEDMALRTEGRLLLADRPVFPGGPLGDQANLAITTSLAARLGS